MSYLDETYTTEKLTYETLINDNSFVLGKCDILPGSDFKIHTHEISETYIVTEGTGEVYNNDHWEPVKKGDIRVFDAGVWHCCRTSNPNGIKLVYFFTTGPFSSIKYIYPSISKL